ncbi:MAG: hypothetical protein C4524_06280 [Candidatus Zixiibacteriota bacterium]|nr:MAG: hypothetical protein C4524_06280 [candidate division Zixibacteria bacterium]
MARAADLRPRALPLVAALPAAQTPNARRAPLSGDRWLARDKADHFLVCAMISSATFLTLKATHNGDDLAWGASLGAAAGIGVAKEIHDLFRPGHTPSFKDLAADLAGALLGAAVAGAL